MEGEKEKHREKKGYQYLGRVELSLFVTPKILNDEDLISVICVAHRYVSSLLATMFSRTGELFALCQTAVRGSCSAQPSLHLGALTQTGGLQTPHLPSLPLPKICLQGKPGQGSPLHRKG